MPDLFWLADLGRASVAALWLPVLAWTAVALVTEAALRALRPSAALALPVRGAVLTALPLAVLVPMVLSALAPDAAVFASMPDPLQWLPEVAVGAAPATKATVPTGPALLDVLLGLAGVAVAAVAVVHALRLGAAVAALRKTRGAMPAAAPAARAAIAQACERFGVTRPVAAAEAPAGVAPFTLGVRHPLVALPADLYGEARELAALHEVAHVRRADAGWHTAQRVVTALFAAHPLVWALGRRLDLDRERAADAAVLGARPDRRKAYADLLFSYAALPAPPLALGAARGSSSLKSRIDAMTAPLPPAHARRLARWGRLAGALALVVTAGLAAIAAPVDGTAPLVGTRLVEGVVTDADTGTPLAGANLEVLGSDAGAATGPDGRYQLDAPAGDQTVRVARGGYETRTVALADGQTELNVALTAANVAPARPIVNAPRRLDPDVFEVVEEMPQLVGGLNGLQERVEYPPLARNAGIEGQVVVQFVVDEEGRVTAPVVLRSPHEMLTEAALQAVSGSRFTPGRQRGEAVKVRFAVPITFRLGEGAPADAPQGAGAGEAPRPDIFEIVEQPPVLAGGLDGLMERVVYPPEAKEAGIEGRVVVQFVVDEEGRVEDARATTSSDPMLAEAALQAVRGSEFTPGRQRGQAVKVRFAVPITFRLPADEE